MTGWWETYLDVAYPAVGCAAYAVVVNKILGLRRIGWDPALAAMAICPLFVGSAFMVATPIVYRAIDHDAHTPNLSTLLVYGLITAFGATAQVLLVLWPTEEHLRRRGRAGWQALWRLRVQLGIFLATLAVLAIMFLASDQAVAGRETPTTFDTSWTSDPPIVTFLVVYQLAFAMTLVQLANLCRSLVNEPGVAQRAWLVRGLHLISRGSLIALGYGACKLAAITARLAGTHADVLSTIVAPEFASVGALLIAIGFSASVIGPRLALYSHYRKVAPLRHSLLSVVPQMRMPRPWWDRLVPPGWRNRDWLRLTLEVRDAKNLLDYYPEPAIAEHAIAFAAAAGMPEDRGRVLAQAAVLRSAVDRYRRGHRRSQRPTHIPTPRSGAPAVDITSELGDLAALADAYFGPVATLASTSTHPAPLDRPEQLRRIALVTHAEDLKLGLTLGLWRTFAHPQVAQHLVTAGGLINDPAARASATGDALIGLMEEGLDSPASAPILSHLRRIHDGIDPDLMRFVLTAFTLPPIRFIDTYSWRPLSAPERDAFFDFAAGLAHELDIDPPDGGLPGWTKWALAYEQQHFAPSPAAQALWASAGSSLAARRLPRTLRRPLRSGVAKAAAVLLDEPVRCALAIPAPTRTARRAVGALLRLRARAIRRRQQD